MESISDSRPIHGTTRVDQSAGGGHMNLTISDILPKTKGINIFASMTRDVASIATRLESLEQKATLMTPLNSVMQNLPRKPWQDRPGDESQIRAADNQDKAAQNLQKFVEDHVVPVSPWREGKEHAIKTIGGQELYWEEKDGQKVIFPGGLIVENVFSGVGNGEIWTIRGVVNYT